MTVFKKFKIFLTLHCKKCRNFGPEKSVMNIICKENDEQIHQKNDQEPEFMFEKVGKLNG